MKKLYWDFHALFGKAYPNLSKSQCKDEADEKWNSMKKDKKTVDMDVYNREVGLLKSKLINRKASMFDYIYFRSQRKILFPLHLLRWILMLIKTPALLFHF